MADAIAPRLCATCGLAPVEARLPGRPPHPNALYCAPCRTARLHRPGTTLTEAQQDMLRPLLGKLPYTELCARVGCTRASLVRWLAAEGLRSDTKGYPEEVVAAVLAAYAAAPKGAGKRRVQELFPHVKVRSIVERYKASFSPRQIRWTSEQLVEAARMAGLVSHGAQARYFHRPNAYDGSLKSLWAKHFQCAPRDMNGLAVQNAWQLALPGCPAIVVQRKEGGTSVAKILWIDLAAWLRPDVAPEIQRAVQALARFQRWLYNVTTTGEIAHMIQEREQHGDQWDVGQERTHAGTGSDAVGVASADRDDF